MGAFDSASQTLTLVSIFERETPGAFQAFRTVCGGELNSPSQRFQQILVRHKVLDENFALLSAPHPNLADVEIGRLVRRKQDVVVDGILVLLEYTRNDVTTQVVVTTGREMACSEHLLVLDIGAGDRQH